MLRFLVDECVHVQIARFLRERNYEAEHVGEILSATSDEVLSVIGNHWGAVIVTADKGFREMIKRAPHGTRTRFSKLSRIQLINISGPREPKRFEEEFDRILFEYERCQRRGDTRLIIDIYESKVTIL